MERRAPLERRTPIKRKTAISVRGASDTNQLKDEIQATLRAIVIARDGGCILRNIHHRDFQECGGFRKDGQPIYQADHLITRANSATFADSRLVVCLCRDHHAWKSMGGNARKAEYDALVRTLISPERVALWERAEQNSWRPQRNFNFDWKLELAALKQELFRMHCVV